MVDTWSTPTWAETYFPQFVFPGQFEPSWSSYGPVLFPSAPHLISSQTEQDRMLKGQIIPFCWVSSLNCLTLLHHHWAGGRAAALSGQAQVLRCNVQSFKKHDSQGMRDKVPFIFSCTNRNFISCYSVAYFSVPQRSKFAKRPQIFIWYRLPKVSEFCCFVFHIFIYSYFLCAVAPVPSTLFVFPSWHFCIVCPNDLIQPGINRMSLLLSCETFCQCLIPTESQMFWDYES